MRQLLMIFFLLTGLAGLGQNVTWEWAKSLSSPYSDDCSSLVIDQMNNIYLMGISSNSLVIDSISFEPSYFFIAGFSQIGNLNWFSTTSGPGTASGSALCKNTSGNIYVSGSFGDTIVFGTDTLDCYQGLFLTKYDINGNPILEWCIESSGSGINNSYCDNEGNICICGFFGSHDFNFGDTIIYNAQTGGSGSDDAFIAKYDSSGNFLWVRGIGSPYEEMAKFITTDSFGDVYLSGFFTSASISFDTIVLTNQGNFDAFLVKYDSEGNVKWAKNFGGTGKENPNGLFSDSFGNVYFCCYYYSPFLNIDGQTLTNPGYFTAFIAKYSPEGNLLWAKNIGEGGIVDNVKITSDGQTRIFVSGYLLSDLIHFGTTGISGIHSNFIAQMDLNGNFSWAHSNFSNSEILITSDFQYCPDNSLIIAGNFTDSLIFGTDTLVNTNTPGFGFTDIFLAKLHIEPTGFEEVPLAGTLQVYPNPASGQFNVVVPGGTSLLRVYDCFGRLLQQYQNPVQGELSIRISNPGLCLVQAFSQNGVLNARVVVR
jgi:hypothetical protein